MTYYVVAQKEAGQCLIVLLLFIAIDYMLGTMLLYNYLQYKSYNLRNYRNVNGGKNTLLYCQNNNYICYKKQNIQSAENCNIFNNKYYNNTIIFNKFIKYKGFSETIRQLSNLTILNNKLSILNDDKFYNWLAGILDGDGNFDVRKLNNKLVLKAIRIKLHVRDIKILNIIQNKLHVGRIKLDKNKPYCTYIISTKEDMRIIINNLNGLIRLKVDNFKKSCDYFNINFIEADYNIKEYDPYFSGLIDTDGSIVFNWLNNRIECNLELKYNKYTSKLCLDNVIPNCKPYIIKRTSTLKNYNKINQSIGFKFQNVNHMIHIYNYFMKNRTPPFIKGGSP